MGGGGGLKEDDGQEVSECDEWIEGKGVEDRGEEVDEWKTARGKGKGME